MKKWKTFFKVTTAFAGFFGACFGLHSCQEAFRFKQPPPGWEIVVNEQGHYGAKSPNEFYPVLGETLYGNPMKTRQEAIDRAWERYDSESRDVREAAQRNPKPVHVWKPE